MRFITSTLFFFKLLLLPATINKGYIYIIKYSIYIYIIYLKSSVYTLSLHSFLYDNACVYIQYIAIYIFYLVTLEFVKIF